MNINIHLSKIRRFIVSGAIVSIMSCSFVLPAHAEVITGTNLSINFESSRIIGSGRNVNFHLVPVINIDNGSTTYYDASFKFTLDGNGELVFDRISSTSISPPISSLNYSPGTYHDSDRFAYELQLPSLLSDGRVLYTLFGKTRSFTLQFVTGSPTGHPDIGNREIISGLNDTYSYGLITDETPYKDNLLPDGYFRNETSEGAFYSSSDLWEENQIIGVRQSGNNLQITLFSQGVDSEGNPQDFSSQRAGAVLTKVIE